MTFHTPSNSAVLQAPPFGTECVTLPGITRVEEMPTVWSAPRTIILPAGFRAVMIAGENPRRKRVILSPGFVLEGPDNQELICIAETEAKCNDFSGVLLESVAGLGQVEIQTTSQIWARPGFMQSTSGIYNGIVPTDSLDVYMTIRTEDWSH